jgi:hypothetical protein
MKINKLEHEIVVKIDHIICDRCGNEKKGIEKSIPNPECHQSKIEEINSYSCDIKFGHCYTHPFARHFDSSEVEIDLCYDCSEFVKNLLRENGVKIEFPNYY